MNLRQADQINENLVSPHLHKSEPLSYLRPLIDAYSKDAYDSMHDAIFPGYFHGKCQIDGVNPKGCPNPNCPVVCGTPGSLVHFYGKLRQIVFRNQREILVKLSKPGGTVFNQILEGVKKDAKKRTPRMIRVYGRAPNADTPDTITSRKAPQGSILKSRLPKRAEDIEVKLEAILKQIPDRLEQECGGRGKDGLEGLEDCSWEDAMKEFILTYP
jgi:hypothetical protein